MRQVTLVTIYTAKKLLRPISHEKSSAIDFGPIVGQKDKVSKRPKAVEI